MDEPKIHFTTVMTSVDHRGMNVLEGVARIGQFSAATTSHKRFARKAMHMKAGHTLHMKALVDITQLTA